MQFPHCAKKLNFAQKINWQVQIIFFLDIKNNGKIKKKAKSKNVNFAIVCSVQLTALENDRQTTALSNSPIPITCNV